MKKQEMKESAHKIGKIEANEIAAEQYKSYKKSYNIRTRVIYMIALILAFATIAFSIVITKSSYVVLGITLVLALFIGLIYAMQKNDDRYISDIVNSISELLDILMDMEKKEIFPESEDTLVSKLQCKTVKLAEILNSRKEMEQREHENIKGLVSDLSHQLKTPISNLKMYLELLDDESLSETQRKEYIRILNLSIERLIFLSESMIKTSRLESGLISLNMQKKSLNETVLKAIKDVYVKAKANDINIVYNEECKLELIHDVNWTAEAVFNLLDNAVKYGKKGSKVTLTIRRLGTFAEIAVEDENELIPESNRNKVFERFYRGENSSGKEGVGIGLYLSREIIVRQGGYMNLRKGKQGNCFTIALKI